MSHLSNHPETAAPLRPIVPRPVVPHPRVRPPALKAIKRAPDGRALLNIGCGARTNWSWTNMDFSGYTRLRPYTGVARLLNRIGLLSDLRYARLRSLDPRIVSWNAARGLPFPDGSFDLVYHSHMLEHLPRAAAPVFLLECRRVLKPGGLLRVVVPDLEMAVKQYTNALERLRAGALAAELDYDGAVDGMFGLMALDDVIGTAAQHPVVRAIERRLRGDSSAAGQRHRWMYDEYSLGRLLRECAFTDVRKVDAWTSRSPRWSDWCLDTNSDGTQYKLDSLFMEAVTP